MNTNHKKLASCAVAALVKTPGYSPIKTRLAASIGDAAANEFYRLSIECIQSTLTTWQELSLGNTAYWAVAEPLAQTAPIWQKFPRILQAEGDLGDRQASIAQALIKSHESFMLIGGDAPQITVATLTQVQKLLLEYDYVFGPALDGGYYLFAARVAVPKSVWKSVQYSQATTLKELRRALMANGAKNKSIIEIDRMTDVDTVQDLEQLRKELNTELKTAQARECETYKLALCHWITQKLRLD